MQILTLLKTSVTFLLVALSVASSYAQSNSAGEWPNKVVRIIVPFGPGSAPDIVARLVADKLSQNLKQPFVIDNKPGASGNYGTKSIVQADPDGYTLGLSITGPLVNNVALFPNLGYDPFKDLAPVSLAAVLPNVLVVNNSLGVKTVPELIAFVKKNQGKLNYASLGSGSTSHLAMELLKSKTNSFILHIPYNASPKAIISIISDETQMGFIPPSAALPQAAAGKLTILAVSTAERFAFLPNIPTLKESGLDNVESTAWMGFVVPKGIPIALQHKIHKEVTAALRDPNLMSKVRAQYMEPVSTSQVEFENFMQSEFKKWSVLIKKNRISAD
jgi:tripartite-type tricarboxylate transporter receptor subunit TctC